MGIICLSFWIGVNLVMHIIVEMKRIEYNVTYISTGQSITLKCKCKVSFWNGPATTNTGQEPSQVEINDIFGDPKVLNITIYMYGGKIAKTLPETLFKRINVIGDNFDLQITNLSTSDEGLYICDLKEYCNIPQSIYLLQTRLLPSKLQIVNITKDNIVNGKENCLLDLVCFVERGKPPAVLRWKKNGILISRGGSDKLVYSFTPNKSDHLSNYTCEAQNTDMTKPLTQSIHLNIKYKPSIKLNANRTLVVVESDIANVCCISRSNPKSTSISWHTDDKELVSAFNTSSLCYKISNVSRFDTGNYTCSSQNEIGNASTEMTLIITYPPVIKVLYKHLTEHRRNRTIQCLPKGEPNSYKFFMWEHTSLFHEHIRYLDGTDDGILRLPDMNVSNIYQDTGFYICNVSNGIPDYQGNFFQLGRAYYLVSIGPPVIAADNERIQDSVNESVPKIKIKVYSPSKIMCHNITEVDSMLVPQKSIEVRTERILIKESFHDAVVTVNGIEITFVLYRSNTDGYRTFNVKVCNSYGQSIFDVVLNPFEKSTNKNVLSSERIINIVLLTTILVLITGIGIYIRYTKHRYRKRFVTEINNQTAEPNVDLSPHYADILEEDNILTSSQENNTQIISETDRIAAGNRNTTALSDDYSSSSSNTDNIALNDLNDGYEKPYTTLISNNADEVEHEYRKTKQTLTYENATAFTNATLGLSVQLQRFSFDITKTNGNSNEDRANTDIHYEENDPQEIDDESNRSITYKQKETVEYINLSLKQ